MTFTLSKISALRVDGTLHTTFLKEKPCLEAAFSQMNCSSSGTPSPPHPHLPPCPGPNSQNSPVICPYSTQANVPNQN
jgi:hypothetical protein